MRTIQSLRRTAVAGIVAIALSHGAAAQNPPAMQLTQDAIDRNFTIETFADGFPTHPAGVGPLGFAHRSDGSVLVTDVHGTVRVFAEAQCQNALLAPVLSEHGYGKSQGIVYLKDPANTAAGYRYFITRTTTPDVAEIDPATGTIVSSVAAPPGLPVGIVSYPPQGEILALRGHIFVSCQSPGAIFDIAPFAQSGATVTEFSPGSGIHYAVDGMCFSPDGRTLYGAGLNGVHAFDVGTMSELVALYTPVTGPDGIAVGLGTLAGRLYVNTTVGTFEEIDLTTITPTRTVLATGGSRGDFAYTDHLFRSGASTKSGGFPSFVITQSDSILRIDPPGGGFLGCPGSSIVGPAAIGEACMPGTVNSGVGPVTDVLRVNGTSAAAEERIVQIERRTPLEVSLSLAPAGPVLPNYAIWGWLGLPANPRDFSIGGSSVGCTVNPTPLEVTQTPRAFRCLRRGLGAQFCGTTKELSAHPPAPFTLRLNNGLRNPGIYTVQGVMQDASNPAGMSVTNAVIIVVH